MNLNRHFIGFEIVPKYYEDSLERLKDKSQRPSEVDNITETIGLPLLESV
jgi:DNA modification methylase